MKLFVAAVLILAVFPTLSTHADGNVRRRRLQITASQLADANTPQKCYLQIDSDVYDATSYAAMHPPPGGPDSIYENCGTDITTKYYAVPSHSAALLALVTNLGPLVADPVPVTPAPVEPPTPAPVEPVTPAPVEPVTPAPITIPVTTPAVPVTTPVVPVTTPVVPVTTPAVPVTNPVTTPMVGYNEDSEEESSASEDSDSEDSVEDEGN